MAALLHAVGLFPKGHLHYSFGPQNLIILISLNEWTVQADSLE